MFRCFRVSIQSLQKMSGMLMRLVVLVKFNHLAGGVRLVQSFVLVVGFSCAWKFILLSIGCAVLHCTIVMISCSGHYRYQ